MVLGIRNTDADKKIRNDVLCCCSPASDVAAGAAAAPRLLLMYVPNCIADSLKFVSAYTCV